METKLPHIVVLGAGFGGLTFCQDFKGKAHITLIDRKNHHLFQPLLYQVATAALSAPDIAQPIRSILTDNDNVTVLMDEATGINLTEKSVSLKNGTLHYDFLILGLGGVTSYFGHPEWEQFAPGLKSLDDALTIRRRVLYAFEKAETEMNPQRRDELLTIVVVGGGPTGVELAGAFSELAKHVLVKDFQRIDPARARVILIEASTRVLSHLSPGLGDTARAQLETMGVEVKTSAKVKNIAHGFVELDSGDVIRAENVIWAAGVGASPLGRQLGVETDRAGRVKVAPDLSIPGHPSAFVIGDMANCVDKNGVNVPGVSPAAMQMARHVAEIIEDELLFPQHRQRKPFGYWDKGTMATIGRSAAVAKVQDFEFSGFLAWLAWLFIHLIFLVGFRNKVAVFLQWVYSYFTYKRGSRIITGQAGDAYLAEEETKNTPMVPPGPAH
ncbi:MAG: ndh [Verrucomicrobiales bacterium]|nr:ndh [Verrucomicrobiales bacterium]